MSGTNEGLGWLPMEAREALEEEKAKASSAEVEKLLALDPRARVLALLGRAACRGAEEADCPQLRRADLARVLESFPGDATVDPDEIAERLPGMVRPTE